MSVKLFRTIGRSIKEVLTALGLWYIPPVHITKEETAYLKKVTYDKEAAELILISNPDNLYDAIKIYRTACDTYTDAWDEIRAKYNIKNHKVRLDTSKNLIEIR